MHHGDEGQSSRRRDQRDDDPLFKPVEKKIEDGANKTFWTTLPQDVRAQLDRAVKESSDFFNATAAKDNDDAIEKIRASGKTEIHILTEAEKKAWISKLMPVHTEMQSRFGKDFIERIYKASGFTPPQS